MSFKHLSAIFVILFSFKIYATPPGAPHPGNSFQIGQPFEYSTPVVLNGNLASSRSQSYRFTVRLKILNEQDDIKGFCTGIVVSKNLIMTAGHCLSGNNLKVDIQFGLGGESGFTHTIRSDGYRSLYPSYSGGNPWKDGYLSYNEESRRSFLENVRQRTDWLNFSNGNFVSYNNFFDIALIKVSGIPNTYSPVKIYNGRYHFKQKAIMAGFGTNSRHANRNDDALRWMEMELIGHYTRQNETTVAWQFYSPEDGGFCFGDSGGPLLVRNTENDELQLIGVNVMIINNCANSSYAVYIKFFREWIQDKAAELNGEIAI